MCLERIIGVSLVWVPILSYLVKVFDLRRENEIACMSHKICTRKKREQWTHLRFLVERDVLLNSFVHVGMRDPEGTEHGRVDEIFRDLSPRNIKGDRKCVSHRHGENENEDEDDNS